VIAGEHAQAAGIDRQRLMQGELGGEVRDRLTAGLRMRSLSTRCCARPRHRRRIDGGVITREELGISSPPPRGRRRDDAEHPHGIAEPWHAITGSRGAETPGVRVPAPPEIDGQIVEVVKCGQEAGGNTCSWTFS
jgi:hypothetical protein